MSMDTGATDFAAAVRAGRYPSDSDLAALDEQASAAAQHAATLGAAATRAAHHHRYRFADALKGAAGDAQVAEVTAQASRWCAHADDHEAARTAVENAAGELRGLQYDIDLLIESAQPHYNAALRLGKTAAAQGILAATIAEADGMVTERSAAATGHITAAGFSTAPAPRRPSTDTTVGEPRKSDHGKQTTEEKGGEAGADAGPVKPRSVQTDLPGTSGEGTTTDRTTHGVQSDLSPGVAASMPQGRPPGGGSSGASGGGSPASAASGLPGSLGSALSGGGMGSPTSAASSLPGSLGSALSGGGLGSPTAAASALPASPLPDMSSAQSSFSPLASAGSSFQSGLASGLGSPGALQPMAPVQPAVSAVQSMATPVMPAAAPSEAAGLGGGGAMMGGGGGAVPPAAMAGGGGAAGALAPYAPAGSGAVPPAAAAATTAAAGSAAGGPGSGGPVQHGAGGSGVPMVASAAGGAVGAVPEPDGNPDLVTAREVLTGLIRGSDGGLELPLYAVAVLRTPAGPQTVVASNVGGGGWVPASVFLPWSARLATADPTLPMGWAARFMGYKFPVEIVLAHYEEVSKTAAGVSISAIATSDPTASIPSWIDSAKIGLREIWATPGEAPSLDGAHVHRLVAIDPRLAVEVARLEDRGEASVWAASQLCAAIVRAAEAENPVAEISLVSRDDVATLVAVSSGGVDWDAYDERVRQERGGVLWPVGPEDLDDSATTQTMRTLYRQSFRAGRIIELVRLWREGPPRIRDIVYCGIMAGQGAAVAEELRTINAALDPRA